MVERRDQLDRVRVEHAVAEDVAGHVADPDRRERIAQDVDPQLPEVPLDRFPRAAGGDAERLVIESRGTAAGERVPEPEPVPLAHRVRRIRERRRPLVRGHHEVRVGPVERADTRWMHDRSLDVVVREIQEPVHERHVLGEHLRLELVRCARPAFQDEAALGSVRHDDRVLDLLGLHQAEDLGPVVLLPVGPPDATARDHAGPQMDRLHRRRIHEDLEQGERLRHLGNVRRPQLDGEGEPVRPVGVRAHGGLDRAEERAQDQVLVERRDPLQILHDLVPDRRRLLSGSVANRIELRLEQVDEPRGNLRVRGHRIVAVLLRESR